MRIVEDQMGRTRNFENVVERLRIFKTGYSSNTVRRARRACSAVLLEYVRLFVNDHILFEIIVLGFVP